MGLPDGLAPTDRPTLTGWPSFGEVTGDDADPEGTTFGVHGADPDVRRLTRSLPTACGYALSVRPHTVDVCVLSPS